MGRGGSKAAAATGSEYGLAGLRDLPHPGKSVQGKAMTVYSARALSQVLWETKSLPPPMLPDGCQAQTWGSGRQGVRRLLGTP